MARRPKSQQAFDFGGPAPSGQEALFGTTTRRAAPGAALARSGSAGLRPPAAVGPRMFGLAPGYGGDIARFDRELRRAWPCPDHDWIVRLFHDPNVDLDDRGGYWGGAMPPAPEGLAACARTPREASEHAQRFIAENDLGGGNWTGGQLWRRWPGGAVSPVGRVQYNGRVFSLDGEPLDEE